MNQSNATKFTYLGGGEAILCNMFTIVNSDEKITDSRDNIWNKKTISGWTRETDNFFWPFNPLNTDNPINRLPPTINQIAKKRNKFL
jgi:hypothetical protein